MTRNYYANEPLTKKEQIYYALCYCTFYLLSLIPFKIIYILSDMVFLVIYHVVKYRRPILRKNLKDSFPHKSKKELQRIERNFYHWFCDYIFETIKLLSMSESTARKRMTFDGIDNIQQCLDEGYNIALYIGHYCNWEWITTIALHLPGTYVGQVYHILENKVMNRLIQDLRSKKGTHNITRNQILRTTIEHTKNGKRIVVGFVADSAPEIFNVHHWIHFLNHDTAVITGAETLAKRCNYACLYLKQTRPARGYYHIQVIPMIKETASVPDFKITEQYFQLLEQSILEAPEYWLWTHNRWKRPRAIVEAFQQAQRKKVHHL